VSQSAPNPTAVSLLATLDHQPVPLKFGTSGRRGLVVHLTQLEVYINVLAELQYLQSLPRHQGGIIPGEEVFFAADLRPSSTALVPSESGRGELAQAICAAIRDAEMVPCYLGEIPTPALACYAFSKGQASIMVTGSHIPFDRNGYKLNTSIGELLKKDEAPIQTRVDEVRARIYGEPAERSLFDSRGMLRVGHQVLPAPDLVAREAYVQRYLSFFSGQPLSGKRLLVYQHSAVGRDLLVEVLRALGAEVVAAGRSDTFVPIDTENLEQQQLQTIQSLAAAAWTQHGPLDAVVSADGDSDRPLVLGVEAQPASSGGSACRVRFFGGDLLGMIVAEYLGADAVVVPISCNDAVDRGPLQAALEPKTRIGSPYVIAGMEKARGKSRRTICGWEANGGFLLGSDVQATGRTLAALPTRDAFLPILAALHAAARQGITLATLFDRLPKRFSRAALLKNFPRPASLEIVRRFSPDDPSIKEVSFAQHSATLLNEDGGHMPASLSQVRTFVGIRDHLAEFFTPALGFAPIARLNYVDGVRIHFENGEVAHVRPSGNADELRFYAVADSQARADAIAELGVAEPLGILRRLESSASKSG